ncbi:hypothetical protein BABINDRAFT_159614 [Babjeviella inositovora NRRL Y-12698]|uniref:MHD domain-containing protein n=1 Tax=Babjeviella inositovora NRRL Y-12698 TaxID=984486 RepID=A0A1E3QZW8_9ASCO|nr:uncharacterized protein BABINDRAFT_159614 [Babjeviella inositovora NRRL Y-12698]ODQ83171.1 hypothetical protein BABINDRAFT_159614 [Babjeviella inositovora NRRL Y-12698]
MSEEHTQYASTILVSKLPVETSQYIGLRFQANNLFNDELMRLLSDLKTTEDRYASDLQKLLSRGSGISTAARARLGVADDMDVVGQVAPLWNSVLATLGAKVETAEHFSATLHRDVLHELNNFSHRDARHKETGKLVNTLATMATRLEQPRGEHGTKDERDWSSKAPYILESFENYDLIRLSVLRDVFLKMQTTWGDQLGAIIKASEKSTELLLNFDPHDEIVRFSELAISTSLSARAPMASPTANSFGGRVASTSSIATTGSPNNPSQLMNGFTGAPQKSQNRLKSKVGSIFSRKKKDKKGSALQEVPETARERSDPVPALSRTLSVASTRRHQSREQSSQRESTRENRDQGFREQSLKDQREPNREQALREPELRQSFGKASSERGSFAPLQPTIKMVNDQKALPNPVPAQPQPTILPVEDSQLFEVKRSSIAQAPAPPPARKNTIKLDGSHVSGDRNVDHSVDRSVVGETNDLRDISASEEDTSVGELPSRINLQKRKEIHSTLFHDLPAANPTNRDSVMISRPPSISTSGLVSQNTGSTLLSKPAMFLHSTLDIEGLSASVAEVVNASFKEGVQVKAQTIGEIAFCYKGEILPQSLRLQFDNFAGLGQTLVNPQLLHQVSDHEFLIDPALIHLRSLGALKYQLKSDVAVAPVVVLPVWRFEAHQASVMLMVKLAPEFAAKVPESGVTLHNFIVSVSIAGAPTSSASSRPQGSFNKEKSRITWKYSEPLTLSATKEERLVARFMTDGLTHEGEHGVQIKFSLSSEDSPNSLGGNVQMASAVVTDQGETSFAVVPSYTSVCAGSYNGFA